MAALLPDYDEGPLRLGQLREEARKLLVDALDSRRGKKVLVLDPKISGFLGLLAEVALLKEHGVEQLLHLDGKSMGDLAVRTVIYLVRARVENAQLVAQQIKATAGSSPNLDHVVYLVPRRTIVCEKVLQEEGVYGDVTLAEYPLDFIPFDYDILSLELDTAYRELAVLGERGSLFYTARALMRLQSLFGAIPIIKGRGPAAAAVKDMLTRMRKELGPAAPPLGGHGIDELILVERGLDLATPMCTQLTYEGILDETLHIRNGAVQLDTPGGKQRFPLNSADRTFRELRDLSFAAVAPSLGQRAKSIQSDYNDSKAQERSIAELKEFASQLKALPQIQRHISLVEAVNKIVSTPTFRSRVSVEQSLLDGHGIDAACEAIEELMYADEDILVVLRLLCLLSITQGGVPKKHYDNLRREVLHTYGHEHILTLSALHQAGLLRKQEGKSSFAALKRGLHLLVDDVDDKDPADIAYVFSGYAPLSIRLIEAALKGPGWGGLPEDTLRHLPGPGFEVEQVSDGNDMPLEQPLRTVAVERNMVKRRRVVLVMFIGGVTFAEVAALRFLSRRPDINAEFVTATTKLISGNTLIQSLIDDTVTDAMAASQLD